MTRPRSLQTFVGGSDADFRRKLHRHLARFLAYCSIVRACRPVWQFQTFKPVVLGIVLPEGADVAPYEEAVRYAAHGPAVATYGGGRDDTEVQLMKNDRRRSSGDADLSEALAKKSRVILVAQDSSSVPDTFLMTADAIVDVGTTLPSHVIAAARMCLGLKVSQEQAEFIATIPLPIIVSTLRRGRSVTAAINLMKKAVVAKRKEVSGPTLDDLHGLGEAGEWGRELSTDLADWKTGKIGWEDVDRGILLSGPPGTGKTTFAGALARSCGVHLVLGSIRSLAGDGSSRRPPEGHACCLRRSPQERAFDHLPRRDRRGW